MAAKSKTSAQQQLTSLIAGIAALSAQIYPPGVMRHLDAQDLARWKGLYDSIQAIQALNTDALSTAATAYDGTK